MPEMSVNTILLDDTCDIQRLLKLEQNKYEAIICLFWASPETKQLISRVFEGTCYSLGDIIENVDVLEKELTERVREICDKGPHYKGLAFRRYLSEEIFRSWFYPKVCVSAKRFLDGLALKVGRLQVNVVGSEQTWTIFERLSPDKGNDGALTLIPHAKRAEMCVRKPLQASIFKRVVRQVRGAKISGQWRSQVWNLIEKIDNDYEKRCAWNRFRKSATISSGIIVFFSSYLNNSRILQPFERLMPGPVHWIVTNYYSWMPISGQTRSINWIWDFGNTRGRDVTFKDDSIYHDCRSALGESGMLQDCQAAPKIIRNWSNGQLRSLANLTNCWEKYLEDVAPRLIVMANQWGIEGWFAEIAKRRGIPVLQVMHGVLGGYFHTQSPIISDRLVVPGEFWRNLWPKDEQAKVVVFNPSESIGKVKKRGSPDRRQITFFSWPLHSTPFYNSSEVMKGFMSVFHKLLSKGHHTVLVRAHPLENPSDFVKQWKKLYGPLPPRLRVGKHEPLNDVLAQTDVGLMFRSTVMLNCMANGIPILMPGWIDFGLNKVLKEIPGVFLADDVSSLESRLLEWIDDPPKVPERAVEYFAQTPDTGRESFVSLVNDLLASGRSSC